MESPEEPIESGSESAAVSPPVETTTARASWARALVHVAILLVLAVAVFGFQLGAADWEDDSESCGGQIVQELVSGQGWIMPLRNERLIPVKPPLFYWLGALTAKVRGTAGDIFDTRFPSVVLGALGVIVTYGFARALAGEAVGLWAGLMLITTPQYVIESRNSRVDIALAFFLVGALFLAYRVLEGRGGRGTNVLVGLCVGCAVLSKGPLALGLAVMVLGATAVVNRPCPGWRALLSPWTLAGAIVLPALWYLAAAAVHGMPFLKLHFFTENVGRLLGHEGEWPLWFYPEPLLTGGLPWLLLLPFVLIGTSALPRRARLFLGLWIVLMLVFFSVSPGKRRAYLLPLRPPLAILLAAWWAPALERWRGASRPGAPPAWVHVTVAVVVVAGIGTVLGMRAGAMGFGANEALWSHWWRAYFDAYFGIAVGLVVALGVGVEMVALWLWQRRYHLAAYAFTGTVAVALSVGISAGAFVRGEGASYRPFAREVAARVPATQRLTYYGINDDHAIALLFHLHRHVAVLEPNATCVPPEPGLYIVWESKWNSEACFRQPGWQEIVSGGPRASRYGGRRMVLARYDTASPDASR